MEENDETWGNNGFMNQTQKNKYIIVNSNFQK